MIRAKEAKRNQEYMTEKGYKIYLYPNDKIPKACKKHYRVDYIPYRCKSITGIILYGYLPPNYKLEVINNENHKQKEKNMRDLTKKEIETYSKTHRKLKYSKIFNEIDTLSIGRGILIENNEWLSKSSPASSINRYFADKNKKFKVTMADGGWAVVRIK